MKNIIANSDILSPISSLSPLAHCVPNIAIQAKSPPFENTVTPRLAMTFDLKVHPYCFILACLI
jgi:hypothetical protein